LGDYIPLFSGRIRIRIRTCGNHATSQQLPPLPYLKKKQKKRSIPNHSVASLQLAFPSLVRVCNRGVARFNLKNRWFPNWAAEEIAFLNQKIASFKEFLAVIPQLGLVVGEAVFGDATSMAFGMGKAAVCVPEPVRFV